MILLQNVHLVAKWLATLERKLEEHSATANADYRVYISAEPAGSPEFHIIPQVFIHCFITVSGESVLEIMV